MAIVNATPLTGIDPKLAVALSQAWPDADEVRISEVSMPPGAGMSNETVLFRATWQAGGQTSTRRLVARVQPAGPGIFPEYDVVREGRVLAALAGVDGIPVPEVVHVESDPSLLGSPFLILAAADGRGPTDDPPYTATGWVLDLAPASRREVCDQALQVMARLHALDWRALDLDFLDRPDLGATALEQRLEWERRFYDWAGAGEPNKLIDATFAWLDDNRPADVGEPVLNWGDGRISNILYGDDLRPAAVVDFEVAALAPPEADLGWHVFALRHHTDGIRVPLPAGFPSLSETVARYEHLTGRPVRHLEYFEVLAGLRAATMMIRAARMLTDAGLLPPDNTMGVVNPASVLLAGLIGEPVPTGEAVSFIGNRS